MSGQHAGVKRGPSGAAVVAVALLLAVGAVAGALTDRWTVPGDGVDLYGTLWFFWWIRDSVEGLHSPSFTDLFFFPYGKDIFAHTGNNFVDAVLSLPLQWGLPGHAWYTVWVVVVLTGNAAAMWPLARQELEDRWPAAIATLCFALSPFVLFELTTGRPTQAMVWWIPMALYGWRNLERGWRHAVLCGVGTALTGWTYWFNGYFLAFAMAWLLGVELWTRRDRPEARRAWLRGLAQAVALGTVLVLPGVVAMALHAESGQVPGIELTEEGSWFDPPGRVDNGVPDMLMGYSIVELEGARFLHYPLWGGGLLLFLLLGRGRLAWGGVAVVSLLLATGPDLRLTEGSLAMYHYRLLYHLVPFFDRLWFPYRALSITFLVASLGLGALARQLRERLPERWWWSGLLLSVLVVAGNLLPQVPEYTYPLTTKALPIPAFTRVLAQRGGGIIDLPYGISHTTIVWQTRHHLPLLGGMGENAPAFQDQAHQRRLEQSFFRAIATAAAEPYDEVKPVRPGDRERFEAQGFRWVLLHRQLAEAEHRRLRGVSKKKKAAGWQVSTDKLVALLGEPVAVEGPVVVWDLQGGPPLDGLAPEPGWRTAHDWTSEQPPAYEERLRAQGRIFGP